MSNSPSAASLLAALVTNDAEYEHVMASVQRSHRFPLPVFIQIENLAKLGNVPISLVINQLVEAGLDSVKKELPPDVSRSLNISSQSVTERKTVVDRVKVTKKKKRKAQA